MFPGKGRTSNDKSLYESYLFLVRFYWGKHYEGLLIQCFYDNQVYNTAIHIIHRKPSITMEKAE